MKIEKIFESDCNCGNSGCGNCPTVYRLENGDYVIQGYLDIGSSEPVQVPSGEGVVRIPKEFLEGFIKSQK